MEAYPSMKTVFTWLVILFGATWAAQGAVAEEQPEVTAMTVNINEADAEVLAKVLVGVGSQRAQAIIEYRDQYGPFYQAEELASVKGIGDATVAANLDRIRLE